MKRYWEHLRPFERRMVAGVLTLFFIVLNFLFVFPHFSDLGVMRARKGDAERMLTKYRTEIDQTGNYENQIRKNQGAAGDAVAQEDQAFTFQNTVNSEVGRSGVHFTSVGTGAIRTQTNNAFFIEKVQSLGVAGNESQLVDFLYGLGSGAAIRVRDMSLRPDQPRHELTANLQLVASFQKKLPVRTTSSGTQPASARPVTSAKSEPPLAKSANPNTQRP
jgi:hypothetical protein